MSALMLPSRRPWRRQPQRPVALAPDFGKGVLGLFNPGAPTLDWTYSGTSGLFVPSATGGLAYDSNSNSTYVVKPVVAHQNTGFTILYAGKVRQVESSQDHAGLYNGATYQSLIYTTNTGKIAFFYKNGAAVDVVGSGVEAGTRFVICATGNGARYTASAVVGGQRFDVSGAYTGTSAYTSIHCGAKFTLTGRVSSDWATFWNRALPEPLCDVLVDNLWQMLRGEERRQWFAGGAPAGTALSGNAQAIASASGALSTAVPLVGAAVGVVTASGALLTAMPLSGAAAAVASASGAIILGIALSGPALAQAIASGALGTQFALAGGAQAIAAATGQMSIQLSIAGNAIAQASASGVLTVASASSLSGHAQMQATASGAVSTSIPLAGAAHVVATATGDLGSGAALAGAAVAVAAASGNLTVTVNLSGAAVAQAIAAGGLVLQVPLAGAAVASASASGYLAAGNDAVIISAPRNLGVHQPRHRPPALQTQRRPAALSQGRRTCR